jgi:uncharacterized membrane protein YidH (DUF202 family)
VDRLEDPEVPTPRDPGLARERTDLTWNRSGLAALVAVAVMLRHLWPLDGYKSALALALIAAGAAVWAVGMRMARRADRAAGEGGVLGERAGRILTAGTVVLAGAGFVLSFVS